MHDQFAESAESMALAAGDELITEGSIGDDVYLVTNGRFRVTVVDNDVRIPIGSLAAGDLIGELGVLAGGVRSATVTALEASEVVRADRASFERWLVADTDRSIAISIQTRRRLDEAQLSLMIAALVGANNQDFVPEVVGLVEWTHLDAGSTLFRQGDASDAAYFVVAGRLRVSGTDDDGRTVFDHEIASGDIVGEMGLIDISPRAGTVTTIRDSTLARIPLESFQQLMTGHPAVMLQVFRRVLRRLTSTQQRTQRARAVTIAITSGVDRRVFATQMANVIRRHGTVQEVRAASVDARLRVPGIANSSLSSPESRRVLNLLHEHELTADYVVYETDSLDGELSEWSRRAIRQADRLIVVSSAVPDDAEKRAIQRTLDVADSCQHVVVWAAIQQPAGVTQADTSDHILGPLVAETHQLRVGRNDDLERLARLATGNGVAVVLSGGGARGYAQLGALRALTEAGVPIDTIGGASMGSVVAGLFALDYRYDDAVSYLTTNMASLLDYTIPVVSLTKGERVWNAIHRSFENQRIEDTWIPFYCVSTNLTRAEVALHTTGAMDEAIRASTAIPGVFPPVPHDGDLLVDGGVLNNLPVDVVAVNTSIGTVIAIDVAPPSGPRAKTEFGLSVSGWSALRATVGRGRSGYPALSSVLMASLLVGSSRDRRQFVDDGMVDLMIELNLHGVGLLEFETVAPVAERGYEAARPVIDSWVAKQPWLSD